MISFRFFPGRLDLLEHRPMARTFKERTKDAIKEKEIINKFYLSMASGWGNVSNDKASRYN